MSEDEQRERERDPAVGLCSVCRHARRHQSRRGSVFWQCAAADSDPRLRRYPPLPVTRCHAYQAH